MTMKEKLKDPNFIDWMLEHEFEFTEDSKGNYYWRKEKFFLSGKELYKLYDQWYAEHLRYLHKQKQKYQIITWIGFGLMVIGVLLFIYTLIIKE